MLGPLRAHLGDKDFDREYLASELLVEIRLKIYNEIKLKFDDAGIRVAPIKGFAYREFYGDLALRPMSDIDLLVPKSHFATAEEILRSEDFSAIDSSRGNSALHHAQTFKRNGVAIDLHRHIIQPGRTRMSMTEIWQRANRSELDIVDLALIHVAHMARQDMLVPAINLVDLMLIAAKITENQRQLDMKRRLHKWRMEPMFNAAMDRLAAFKSGKFHGSQPVPSLASRIPQKLALTQGFRQKTAFLTFAAAEELSTRKNFSGLAHKWLDLMSKLSD